MKKSMTLGLIMFILSAKELTIEQAVEMGIQNNYQVKKEEKNLENVKLQVKEAYKSGMPKLSYSGTFTKMEEYENSSKQLIDSNYSNQLILQQPLFAGGQVITGIKVAGIGEEQRKYALENTKNSVRLEVIESYGSIIKLQKNLGGMKDMKQPPAAIFVVDVKKETLAIAEAMKLGIPVIAMVDTNVDPDNVDYQIPANDDAIRSVSLIAGVIANAVIEGRQGEAYAALAEQRAAESAGDETTEEFAEETAE